MSPSDIEVLIHCHAIPGPHPRAEAPAVKQALDKYIRDGVIEPSDFGGYTTTDKGVYWLQMILKTPYPEQRWLDPRKEKAVNP